MALYGVDQLVAAKKVDKLGLDVQPFSEAVAREREEHAEQIRALGELKEMAASYGYDISVPATTAREAVQWLYFGYLAAVKEQNGAAMSLGRTSTFLDVYIERDLAAGRLTETEAQEIVDDFVIKLRIVRFLRTPPEYDACSPATRPGSPRPSAAWARTAARSSRRTRSASCRPCTTWARRPSRT